MSDRYCAAPRHGEPELTAPSAYLCRPCGARLRSDLRRLPSLHAELGLLLDPRRAGGPGTGDGDGLPYHEPAAGCRDQIAHDARYWVAVVLAERRPPIWPLRALPAMCGWLAGQSAWITFRPWAGDMAGALADDAARARAVLDPRPLAVVVPPAPMNWCPACGERGRLAAAVPRCEGDRRPALVSCGGCGEQWDATRWLRLGRDIIRHAQGEAA